MQTAFVEVEIIKPPRSEHDVLLYSSGPETFNATIDQVRINPALVQFIRQSPNQIPRTATYERGKPAILSGLAFATEVHLTDPHLDPPVAGPNQTVLIVGREEEVRRVLQTGPRDLGVSVALVSGTLMTVRGDIRGTISLKPGERMNLDPAYLDATGEWVASRPSGKDPRYEISLSPNRAFQLEEKRPGASGGPPKWSQVTSTHQPQAACTLRPER